LREAEENISELDLDRKEEAMSRKHLATTIYYSRKSFNPKFMFADMLNARGIPSLALVEKVGDYIFKLEFHKPEEKNRVLEGGLWRHKGDALIIKHYDGCMRPSEVCNTSIALWIRLYDLPQTMIKETFARQLGGLLERFIKLDTKYPGYLRVQVDFPLQNALVPQLKVKIKGRGLKHIAVRYENIPHFCFMCGRMGHAAMNCEEDDTEDHGIKYREELRASPPRRARELNIRQISPRVAKPLFQTIIHGGNSSRKVQGKQEMPKL
jgi:hypothetical protein